MAVSYTNYESLHPMIRAMLAYSDYSIDDRDNLISATSIMKPINMVVLERANKGSDKQIDLIGMIPSVGGNALHKMLEISLENTNDETWKALGISEPNKLDISTEVRREKELDGYIISGMYDVMFRYKDSKWQLGDMKSMSVYGRMIDPKKKEEEWIKQLSIYRWLNQDKDIDDIAVIFTWYTDFSNVESLRNSKYPKSRTETINISLWSIEDTETYLKEQISDISNGLLRYEETNGSETGYECSDEELWSKPNGWAYYAKATSKKATKICKTEEEANELIAKAKDPTAYIEYRAGQKTRCSYCCVQDYCSKYPEYLAKGMIKV